MGYAHISVFVLEIVIAIYGTWCRAYYLRTPENIGRYTHLLCFMYTDWSPRSWPRILWWYQVMVRFGQCGCKCMNLAAMQSCENGSCCVLPRGYLIIRGICQHLRLMRFYFYVFVSFFSSFLFCLICAHSKWLLRLSVRVTFIQSFTKHSNWRNIPH